MKCHIRNTLYYLCFFRPMLKSVIFLSVSTILVCFSVHGNAEWYCNDDNDDLPVIEEEKWKKEIYKKKTKENKRDQCRWKRMNIVDFILGLKDIGNCTKKNKINKKRNGNARKTDDTMALLPNNLSTNNISELISDKL